MPDLLPTKIETPETFLDRVAGPRLAPVAYGAGMLALGAVLLAAKPRIGNVPNPRHTLDGPDLGRGRRIARAGRDSVGAFAPSNVTDSIGRSLLLGGTALLLTRLFDELSGR